MTHVSNFWLRGEKHIVADTIEAGLILIEVYKINAFMGGYKGDIIDFLNDIETEDQAKEVIENFINKTVIVHL